MWTGFASQIIYDEKVTVVEMICASACIVSLICFSMEVERGSLLQGQAHMARHRVGARGNTTVFPLPLQELFAELSECKNLEKEKRVPNLPRLGSELANIVKVIIKGGSQDSKKCITQAVVRRKVVVDLIMHAKSCGHRAYQFIDDAAEKAIRARAESLPENGVPDEILHLFETNDASLEKLQPQKAATPVQGRVAEDMAFDNVRPNAVTDEKSGEQGGDINSKGVSAIESLVSKLQNLVPGEERDKKELTLTTGNEMIDQFEPWYFAIAFAFCFNSCMACPDLERKNRYRRQEDAPRVGINRWVEIIARRVEAQFKRDWMLTYSLWNYIFRTKVNLSRTVYAYDTSKDGSGDRVTGKDIEEASKSICKALKGKYRDPAGKVRPVNGDLTKVKFATKPPLNSCAKKLLNNLQHITAKIPGTQEIRKKMRYMTHSYRVVYGAPIFLTMSPDEKQSAVMLRFSRLRRCDPAHAGDVRSQKWGERSQPSLDEDFLSLSVDQVKEMLPEYDERRAILARDPLAAADGFRVICEVILDKLFGVRFCPYCPECNSTGNLDPCQDLFGSSAAAEGGIFGRADAFIGSIECQKAGSLHMHGHLFLQCLHQHSSMQHIFDRIRSEGGKDIVEGLLKYKAHVWDEAYATLEGWDPERRKEREDAWPEYKAPTYKYRDLMISRPSYQKRDSSSFVGSGGALVGSLIANGRAWLRRHKKHTQLIQEHKQHHVHTLSADGKTRLPLTCCRRRDKPKECRGGFPKDAQVIGAKEAVVMCPGLAKKMKLPTKGRRNVLGSLVGPRTEGNLNGTHGGLAASLGFNTDVQVGYHLPICKETHSKLCTDDCVGAHHDEDIIAAAQMSQDAQV